MSQKVVCTKIPEEEYEYLYKFFTHKLRPGYVKCENFILPEKFQLYADRIQEADVRPDDVWVISFPKSGTTWVQEMVWCISNDVDLEAAQMQLNKRFPFFEVSTILDFRKLKSETELVARKHNSSIDLVNARPSPRFIKTHLPFKLLPEKLRNSTTVKIIYILRHPADTCVSYYYHTKWFEGYKGGFNEFCELFMENQMTYSPYWDHIKDYCDRQNSPNILLIKYEDMKKDLRSVICNVSDFLEKKLTEAQVQKLVNHLSFESMKKNPAINSEDMNTFASRCNITNETGEFIRSGKVGEWKTTMGPEMRKKFDNWIRVNKKKIES